MKSLPFLFLSALASVAVTACGGGGQSAFVAPASLNAFPVPTPTAGATAAPTVAPTTAPTSTPTVAPTAAPTPVPLALRQIGGAPLTATASQLSNAHRNAQTKTQAQGVTNGLPILVESSGMIAAWAGDIGVWTSNVQTSQDIPQMGLTVTPSGALALNNPAPLQSCLGSVSAVCTVHPTAWTFGTSSANGKPVGKQTITVAFADGTIGTTFDYVYDGWSLPCNTGFAYIGGVPIAQATRATSDIYADCVAANIVLTQGGLLISNPTQDQYGRTETFMPTITAAFIINSLITNVPMAAIAPGTVLGIQTRDGGFAKVYFTGAGVPGLPAGIGASGMVLHSQLNGTFAF